MLLDRLETLWLMLVLLLGMMQKHCCLGHVQEQIRAGQVAIRGVNLGGWLVAEHWMTKSSPIWHNVSLQIAETGQVKTLMSSPDAKATRQAIENHHASFITKQDIAELARFGVNLVRVPIGYWILPREQQAQEKAQTPILFSRSDLKYLDLLVRDWANQHNVAVLIDIHAAKGSQNGADHSAPFHKDKAHWALSRDNVAHTVDLVQFLVKRYTGDISFLGINLLNEPNGQTSNQVLYKYYQDAYNLVRAIDKTCVVVIAPLLTQQKPPFLSDLLLDAHNVWVDWHPYFNWGYEGVTRQVILQSVHNTAQQIAAWPGKHPLFIGEWSGKTPGQFDGDLRALREFLKLQQRVFDQAGRDWAFWSWRIDGDEDPSNINVWSMRNLLRSGMLVLT